MTTKTKPTKAKAKAKLPKPKRSDWLVLKAYSGILHNKKTNKYRARITSPTELNANGNPLQIVRTADTLEEALAIKVDLLKKIGKGGKEKIDADRMTFAQLAALYEKSHLFKPVYDDEHSDDRNKQAGVVSVTDGKRAMKMFVEYFGNKQITEIDAQDIKDWKIKRLRTPKERGGGKRSLANVHRELAFLRGAFSCAIPKYLKRNPFTGAKLINQKQEKPREVALTFEEEKRLLDAASEYPFLHSLLVWLIDTGIRFSETKQVERRDINLKKGLRGLITLRARITKGGKVKREVPVLTPRLRQMIEERLADIPSDPHALLFGDQSVRSEFETACSVANFKHLILHDCRHTWITRAVPSGIPLAEAMKMSAHKNVDTFLLYVNPTEDSHRVNAERFAAYVAQGHAAAINQTPAAEMVN